MSGRKYQLSSVNEPEGHHRFSYMLGKGEVRAGIFSWLQSATSLLDATKSYTLLL